MDRYTTRLWVALAPLWPLSIPILWTNPVGCIRWLTYRRGSAASPLTSQGMAAPPTRAPGWPWKTLRRHAGMRLTEHFLEIPLFWLGVQGRKRFVSAKSWVVFG